MMDQKDWSTWRDRAGSMHIVPNNDLVEHHRRWDCICRPAFDAVAQGYGEFAWVFLHEAMDSRLT